MVSVGRRQSGGKAGLPADSTAQPHLLRRFCRAEAGVSAVEFALLLPLMLMLYAGCVEVTGALTVDRKVSRAASTIADLVSQETSISSAQMSNIFDATSAILEPYGSSSAKLLLVVVNVNSATSQTVAWSANRNDTAYGVGAANPITVPSTIAVVGTQMVIGRVQYSYTSPFSAVMESVTGHASYALSHEFMLRPRQGKTITKS